MSKIEKVSTNPLKTLSVEELNEFREAIDTNISIIERENKFKEDLYKKWWDLHTQCLKYAYWNQEIITKNYPNIENKNYGDIIKIMINEELKQR